MASPELKELEDFSPDIQIEILRTRAEDLRVLLKAQRKIVEELEDRWRKASREARDAEIAYKERLAKAESLK